MILKNEILLMMMMFCIYVKVKIFILSRVDDDDYVLNICQGCRIFHTFTEQAPDFYSLSFHNFFCSETHNLKKETIEQQYQSVRYPMDLENSVPFTLYVN